VSPIRSGPFEYWWARQDLNLGPTDYESAALTAELQARTFTHITLKKVSAHADQQRRLSSPAVVGKVGPSPRTRRV
jgi:hypothetical protein